MKRTLTFLMLLLLALGAMALPVDSRRALQTATTFWRAQGLQGALTERPTEFAHLHLFVGEKGGFVIVSADDVARPVLGWSAHAPVGDTLHSSMRNWLLGYDTQIEMAVLTGHSSGRRWDASDTLVSTVGPLMTTTWNQLPFYNTLCPVDSSSQNAHVLTGCVATATAQVMKYWNHPVTGRGSHTYNSNYGVETARFDSTTYAWSQMPNVLTSSSTPAQVAAVAQLMYHVGVAVEMGYGANMSSAYDVSYGRTESCSEHALKQYFRYANTVRSISRGSYSQQEWFDVIRHEIDSLRPVLYDGSGVSVAHAFVCDGYDGQQRLHINWGWGGYCDGYFYSDALDPEGSGAGGNVENSYTMGQSAIIGIEPDSSVAAAQYTVTLAATQGGTVSGAGTYNAGDMVTFTATPASGYRFDHWSDGVGWNPRALPLYGNMNLTATFVRADATDTLQWDNGAWTDFWYFNQSPFGNRLLPISRTATFADSLMAGRRQLTAVMYFTIDTGMHTVNIYYGDSTYSKTARALYPGFWNTMYMDDTILLDTNHSVSVTVVWPQRAPLMASNVFPIRAITDGMFRPHVLTVIGGTGSGVYPTDTTVAITAVPPDSGYVFLSWSDGVTANPRTVRLTSDSTFTAVFRTPDMFYLNVVANDTSLGYVTNVSGWYINNDYNVLWRIGEVLNGDPRIVAHPYAHARVDHWDVPQICIDSGAFDRYSRADLLAVGRTGFLHDTVTLTAVFVPVNSNDTLHYDDRSLNSYKRLSDTSTYYRWGVKYDTAALAGCTVVSAVEAYFMPVVGANNMSACQYTIQVCQGGNDSPSNILRSETLSVTASGWRTVNFSTPVAISSSQPLWIVISCRHTTAYPHMTPLTSGNYCGNPNGNYVWTSQYGWSHFNESYGDNGWEFDPSNDWTFTTWLIHAITTVPPTPEYTITVVSNNPTMGTVQGGGTFEEGTQTTISAIPNTGYHFIRWQDGNTANPRTITVTADRTYTAYFEADAYTITVVSDNPTMGTVEGGGSFAPGTRTTIRAVPNEGIRFTRWQDGNTANPRTITVTGDCTYTAYFEPDVYVITVISSNRSMGSVEGGGSYVYGRQINIRAIPNEGFIFTSWQDGNSDNPRTITVYGNSTYTAYFEPAPEEGIDNIGYDGISVYTRDGRLMVEGTTDEVRVFDVMGRRIRRFVAGSADGESLPIGVYMVQVGNRPARKIVILQ